MKKWVWVVATIVVALLIGGYAYSNHHATAKEYDAAMTNGRTALQAKNYTQAETYFQNALKRKLNDPKAQTYLLQTQRFVAGENALTARKFANAQNRYQKVQDTKDGSGVLRQRAKKRLTQVKGIRANVAQFKAILKQAQAQNQALDYGKSNSTLDQLFTNKQFQESYYKNLYTQALALRKANNASQSAASSSTTTTSDSAATSSSRDTTSGSQQQNSSSAALTSSESKAAKNYQGSNEYTVTKKQKELNGKVITAAQISSARQTINAAGGQADAMSDQDVRVAMQQAHKKGISLTKYTQTYLK
ncbi:lipoprotein [Levilactobacillus namurensis DSM 19117]|uniref:Lipoprotein n=1 Tax=Levilactobacillus namurensis DSM 19117 TaxID=1423773 RepID=A0A0R1K1G4_9LACO|nr:hypothetical protein [Levilactobacillus namurensis]KRK74825.1 lipoprotein [Levilactobacillus namurensis DSM 19117]GEO74961.1 hypothetical protein LNA02_16590 [Levilactobacillus namurensis]